MGSLERMRRQVWNWHKITNAVNPQSTRERRQALCIADSEAGLPRLSMQERSRTKSPERWVLHHCWVGNTCCRDGKHCSSSQKWQIALALCCARLIDWVSLHFSPLINLIFTPTTETAMLLPSEFSKSRRENDTTDIRRNLKLRYTDYKSRDHEWVYHFVFKSHKSLHARDGKVCRVFFARKAEKRKNCETFSLSLFFSGVLRTRAVLKIPKVLLIESSSSPTRFQLENYSKTFARMTKFECFFVMEIRIVEWFSKFGSFRFEAMSLKVVCVVDVLWSGKNWKN
jgi:hypothetical protein